MIDDAGGMVVAGGLAVSAHVAPNMSVNVQGGTPPLGQVWIPGSSIPRTQGLYFCWNDAPVNKPISASSEADPRVDTVIARVHDEQYAGAENKWEIEVEEGTPTPGATLENLNGVAAVPASSVVLAYVLVPAKAVAIEGADIKNVAGVFAPRSPFAYRRLNADTLAANGDFIEEEAAGHTVTLPEDPGALIEVASGFAGAGVTTVKASGANKIYGDGVEGIASIALASLQNALLYQQPNGNWWIIGGGPDRTGKWTAWSKVATAETSYEHEYSATNETQVNVQAVNLAGIAAGLTIEIGGVIIVRTLSLGKVGEIDSEVSLGPYTVPPGQKLKITATQTINVWTSTLPR